jgi:hypothetical protein
MSATSRPTKVPFFHQPEIHQLVEDLSALGAVTFYVGAGVSIGRTGLTWAGLSAQLLQRQLGGNYGEWIDVIRTVSSPLGASSAIAQSFLEDNSAHWRDRLTSEIRSQLYSGPRQETSYFSDRVVALANAFIGTHKSAVIVTPNYDNFLIDAASNLKPGDRKFSHLKVVSFGLDANGRVLDVATRMRRVRAAVGQAANLCIVYLHGLIDDPTPNAEIAYPVVSEADYATTRHASQDVLGALFASRDIIIVGSSITDPPLIHALSAPRPNATALKPDGSRARRFAIIPAQGTDRRGLDSDRVKKMVEIDARRAKHLDLEVVRPPYYFQAPQILEETRIELALEHGGRHYSDADAEHRYGGRLLKWWHQWSDRGDTTPQVRQRAAYQFLKTQALPELRSILEIRGKEDLKLEAWVRWEPEERQLALWASSTGDWPEPSTMRKIPLAENSRYTAVMSLLNGAPTYAKGIPEFTRWGSFLAVPIHFVSANDESLPVGAICVASMKTQENGSLNPLKRSAEAKLFVYLASLGSVLMDPTYPFSRSASSPMPEAAQQTAAQSP